MIAGLQRPLVQGEIALLAWLNYEFAELSLIMFHQAGKNQINFKWQQDITKGHYLGICRMVFQVPNDPKLYQINSAYLILAPPLACSCQIQIEGGK